MYIYGYGLSMSRDIEDRKVQDMDYYPNNKCICTYMYVYMKYSTEKEKIKENSLVQLVSIALQNIFFGKVVDPLNFR